MPYDGQWVVGPPLLAQHPLYHLRFSTLSLADISMKTKVKKEGRAAPRVTPVVVVPRWHRRGALSRRYVCASTLLIPGPKVLFTLI